MPLTFETDPTSPAIRWAARCDNPACPSEPYVDQVLPTHVEPHLTTKDQIDHYVRGLSAKKGFAHRDGGFLCDACFKASRRGNRASWDEYFVGIAKAVATRATCDRKHVGAVLVRDRNILATGYNGGIAGLEDCDTHGHLMEDGHCVRTIHAEQNALVQAAKHGHAVDGATAYVTAFPCWNCFKMLMNAGVVRIVFSEAYRIDPKVAKAAAAKNVNLVNVP